MPRRRKARLTLKKKVDKKVKKAPRNGLSELQFAALRQDFGSFHCKLNLGYENDNEHLT